MKDDFFVSVIIPVFGHQQALSYCLEALRQQTYPQDSFEIILVNNDPQVNIGQDFKMTNLRVVQENKPGSYAARNTGIKSSQGNILGFCDADCQPSLDWLEKAVGFLSANPGCQRLAGKIELLTSGSKQLSYAERYEKIFAFRQEDYANQGLSATANMFAYRSVFNQVGLFKESLFSGGDLEWGQRAQRAGYRLQYVPQVLVSHQPRRSIRELIHKAQRVCSGYIEIHKAQINRHPIRAAYHGLCLLKPPLKAGQMIFVRQDMSLKDKVVIYLLEYLLKLIQLWEYSGLQLGKKAKR